MMDSQYLALLLAFCAAQTAPTQNVDWPAYLGGDHSSQYSSVDQINRDNVHELRVAWTYRTGDTTERSQIQCNPIVIDGVLYATSPGLKVFALDAATGAEKWTFDPFEGRGSAGRLGTNRGVVFWRDAADTRILFTAGPHLIALNAENGEPISAFGSDGRVDLREGLDRDPQRLFILSNTPGVVYNDLIILGSRVSEALPSAPGHIRAYNVRTGKPAWTFHTIPHPGEFGHDTWPTGAWKYSGGANAWAGMSLDRERGLVFVPTGAAAYDFYGADRHGKNLFANTLLALNAETGERLWHFQMVHHDLWDRDLPAPPNLLTVTRDGERVDAVAQITKSAHIFLFDRETGEPLFPIEERPVPPSPLPGEAAWPTQPFPAKPPPFARQAFTEDEVTNISPQARAHVLERLKRSRTGKQFIPPSEEGTIVFPGLDGGGEWGGAAVDPEFGVLYVNASEMAWLLQMVEVGDKASHRSLRKGRMLYARHCLYCHGVDLEGDPLEVYPPLTKLRSRMNKSQARAVIQKGQGAMPAFPHLDNRDVDRLMAYLFESPDSAFEPPAESNGQPEYKHTGYIRFLDPNGYPAVKPPWGTLNAIDLNKGEIRWKVTLGNTPELEVLGIPQTGAENYGGPVVTAGGLLFIGATKDEKFRAFNKTTGELLWETQLPAGGYATPATYAVNGTQYIVIAAGGGKMGTKPADAYVAFALPRH